MSGEPDPRPRQRVRDPELMATLAAESRECCLATYADDECVTGLSRHHIHKHPRDDVRANIAIVCGDGTRGHHGKLEAHDHVTEETFAAYLLTERADTLNYLATFPGGWQGVLVWLAHLTFHDKAPA